LLYVFVEIATKILLIRTREACFFVLILLLSLSTFASEEQEVVRLFSKGSYPLSLFVRVLEDKTNELTIDQVSSLKYRQDFYVMK